MNEKLEGLVKRYEEITMQLAEQNVASDRDRFRELMKAHGELEPIAKEYEHYQMLVRDIADSEQMLADESDEEMRSLLKEELKEAKAKLPEVEHNLQLLLLPSDPDDSSNVIVEIRAGVGGDEAALFAANLYRMYTRYAERHHWRVETIDYEEIGIGGMKTVSFMIEGQGAFGVLKYESGVHRVQRVPVTEAGGRIHTSTATVAVMPEAGDVDIDLNMDDCRIDVFRSSGAGGQHINKTSSAIRITHIPTGIVVSCQNERSQFQNKDRAIQVLRAMLYDMEKEKRHSEEDELRRSQIGTGDRSEKIRTYNFPQGRVTDHRIKLTLYKIDQIMDGDLEELTGALKTADQTAKLLKFAT